MVIEGPTPLRDSALWKLQRAWYEERGLRAWSEATVPHFVTSNSFAARATVRTEIRRDGGSIVKVNYSLRKTEAGWKAWDVVIEGISYVKSFQEDFGPEVEQKGLDSLIQRLESSASAAKPAKRS